MLNTYLFKRHDICACIQAFMSNEDGAMSIEAAIITAALVALAIVFKKQLSRLWNTVAGEMSSMEQKIKQ
jgi:Flp pilus assembly pilin Flp